MSISGNLSYSRLPKKFASKWARLSSPKKICCLIWTRIIKVEGEIADHQTLHRIKSSFIARAIACEICDRFLFPFKFFRAF